MRSVLLFSDTTQCRSALFAFMCSDRDRNGTAYTWTPRLTTLTGTHDYSAKLPRYRCRCWDQVLNAGWLCVKTGVENPRGNHGENLAGSLSHRTYEQVFP